MFDRLTLVEDLVDCRGAVIARKGLVVSPETIADAAQHAAPAPRRALGETPLAREVARALDDPAHAVLFRPGPSRDAVEQTLLEARLPEVLLDEVTALRHAAPGLERHAFATAAVAVRMLLAAVGGARAVPDLATASLLHDLGMRHLPTRLHGHHEGLAEQDARLIAAHPLVGAYHLATVLGVHPAVAAARSHHWRCGQGYPGLAAPPSRSIEVIAVASAFAALTQSRPFRSAPYDARGAADVLVAEVKDGHADANTVKLLVHALRGGGGDPRAIRFGVTREGHGPDVNRHTSLSGPARSAL
jgi:hypothetical protein